MHSDNLLILNETFYINNDLDKSLDILSKLRKKIISREYKANQINCSKEIIEFNRSIEKVFGFNNFALIILFTPYYNACTMPIGTALDTPILLKNKIEKTETGIRYKKDIRFNTTVYINYDLMASNKFTDREVLAIILHEIGHNFTGTISDTSFIYNTFMRVMVLLTNILYYLPKGDIIYITSSSKLMQLWVNKTHEQIAIKYPGILVISDTINLLYNTIIRIINIPITIISLVFGLLNPLLAIIGPVIRKVQTLLKNPILIPRIVLGFKEEKLSDTFATMYGYGPDLTSALLKFDKYNGGVEIYNTINNKMSYIGGVFNLVILLQKILTSPLDEHPSSIYRAEEQLIYLKRELLKDNIDPKMEKEILIQIDKCQGTIDDYLKLSKENASIFEEPKKYNKLYSAFMVKICGGDIRGLFDNEEKYYKEIEKNVKVESTLTANLSNIRFK